MMVFLLRLIETFFRRWYLYLLPIPLLLAAGVLTAITATPTYMSSAAIHVQEQSVLVTLASSTSGGFSWVTPAEATSNEIKELISTDAFVWAVLMETDLREQVTTLQASKEYVNQIRESIWADPWRDNLVLLGAIHERPDVAQQLVVAMIDAFLNWKSRKELEDAQAAVAFFETQLATYQAEMNEARQAMQTYSELHPAPLRGDRPPVEELEIKHLEQIYDMAAQLFKSARDKLESARLSQSLALSKTQKLYPVIDPPNLPLEPNQGKMDMLMTIAVFAIAGIALSGGTVLIQSLVDRSMRFELDVRQALDLPVLAILPDEPQRKPAPAAQEGQG